MSKTEKMTERVTAKMDANLKAERCGGDMSAYIRWIAVLGIINMTGNISSLHWYHRQRVTKEDRKPFGKLVGNCGNVRGNAVVDPLTL
ncbi:MAG: hypothetical protein IJX94_05390 [Clostridia bacterium]|nr:hypothetical protein [Clostridia bacterium]